MYSKSVFSSFFSSGIIIQIPHNAFLSATVDFILYIILIHCVVNISLSTSTSKYTFFKLDDIYSNFSTTVNRVNFDCLFDKLARIGIMNLLFPWIRYYLIHWAQFVNFYNSLLFHFDVSTLVPPVFKSLRILTVSSMLKL